MCNRILFPILLAATLNCANSSHPEMQTAILLITTPRAPDSICHWGQGFEDFLDRIDQDKQQYGTILIGDSISGQICTGGLSDGAGGFAYPGLKLREMQNVLARIKNQNPESVIIGSAGINNFGAGESAQQVTSEFHSLVNAVRSKWPAARVASYGLPPNSAISFVGTSIRNSREHVNEEVESAVDCYAETNAIFGISKADQIPAASYFMDDIHPTGAEIARMKSHVKEVCEMNI